MTPYVVAFIFLLYSTSANAHGSTLKSIAKEISGSENTTHFTVGHVNQLFNKIGFKNCSNASQNLSCQLCLGSNELLSWYGYQGQSSFNESQLESLLSGIVYLLAPINQGSVGAVCNRSIATQHKNLSQNSFNSLLRQYGNGQASLGEKQIDTLLEDINSTLQFRLTKLPCFDVDDALKGAGLSEAVKSGKDLEEFSAYLVLQLLEGHCIAEHKHTASLPIPKEFIDIIFKEYGTNGKISLAKFESLLKKLGIGNEPAAATTSTTDHSGHDHRKRRSVDSEAERIIYEQSHLRKRRNVASGNATSNVTGKCFTPENLLSIHSVQKTVGISETQFKDMCPSLIQQIESGACKTTASTTKTSFKEEGWKPWVSAIIAVLIISIGSLLGILVAPFSKEKSFTVVLTFLIAIAVSTLLGDAVLHLFPHSLGLHKHEEGADHNHTSITDSSSFVWKSLVFLVGVYFFYLFEIFMHSMSKHKHSHGLEETHQHVGKGRTHSVVSGPVEIIKDRKDGDASQKKDSGYIGAVCGLHKCEEEVCIDLKHVEENNSLDTSLIITKMSVDEWSPTPKEVYINDGVKGSKESNLHDKGALVHSKGQSNGHAQVAAQNEMRQWKSVAWMVLIGDGIHNFLDGVAIGVAFTDKFPSGFFGGISTSIAILCHELPHELGDFAILIQSGLSIKLALTLNFLSSLTSVLGAIIGVSLGQAMDASYWIFALTAGLFVYIALADMLPELIHSGELRHSPMKTIVVQNAGLFIGFGIMICLALFEEKIKL